MSDRAFTDDEFLEVANLAGLRAPSDAGERAALLRAHRSLEGFAAAVTRLAASGGHGETAPGQEPDGEPAEAPLREDRPKSGLSSEAALALAPASGPRRLVRVPGVL